MAIDETTAPPAEVPERTILAAQFDERMAAEPWTRALFVGVVATGASNAFGLLYEQAKKGWRYFIRIKDVALIVACQKFAMRILVKDGANRILAARLLPAATDQELDAAVDAMMAAGITYDHARTATWEDLEARRRAGESLAVEVEVAEGADQLAAHNIPF